VPVFAQNVLIVHKICLYLFIFHHNAKPILHYLIFDMGECWDWHSTCIW